MRKLISKIFKKPICQRCGKITWRNGWILDRVWGYKSGYYHQNCKPVKINLEK